MILRRLSTEGKVRASELSDDLGVSLDTVRRDLAELAAAGALRRVHGGALPPASPGPWSFKERLPDDVAAKAGDRRGGGRARAPRRRRRVSGGTTILELARRLPDDLEATVVTMSPDVAVALADHPGLTVDVVGGRLHPQARTVTGPGGRRGAPRRVRPDLCLLSACSLHPVAGLTLRHREEAAVVRAMVEGAARVVSLDDRDEARLGRPVRRRRPRPDRHARHRRGATRSWRSTATSVSRWCAHEPTPAAPAAPSPRSSCSTGCCSARGRRASRRSATGSALSDGELGLALAFLPIGAIVAMPLAGALAARVGSRRATRARVRARVHGDRRRRAGAVARRRSPSLALRRRASAWARCDVAMNVHGVTVERRYGRPILSGFHAAFSLGGLAGAALGALAAGAGLDVRVHLAPSRAACAAPSGSCGRGASCRRRPTRRPRRTRCSSARPGALWALGALAFACLLIEGGVGGLERRLHQGRARRRPRRSPRSASRRSR